MGAPKGNEYYLLRTKHGRDTEYTPDSLLEKANEYFNWCLDNPLLEDKSYHAQGVITHAKEEKIRPFSIQGFCNFAEIVKNTFLNYEKGNDKDFLNVTTRIRGIIENQQFEGAAAGFLNPNIIARKLGLIDKQEVKKETNSKTEINLSKLSLEELKSLKELQDKAKNNND